MAPTRRRRSNPGVPLPAPATLVPPLWWLTAALEVNRLQWQAFLTWQQSLVAYEKDLCEQWAVRYTGGCPIDG